jgi:hypothetical protein
MRKNSKQTAGRTLRVLGRHSQITRLTGVLGTSLLLALLGGADQARGASLPGSDSATLVWDSSPSAGVAGYRVYMGATSRNYTSSIVAGNATTNTFSGLVSGTAYFFAVKAYDASGLESTFSNEISFLPGGATIQIQVTANGQAVLTLNGTTGHLYDIQATPDFTTWSVIGNVTMGAGGSLNFTDTNAPSFPKRFYRAHATQP